VLREQGSGAAVRISAEAGSPRVDPLVETSPTSDLVRATARQYRAGNRTEEHDAGGELAPVEPASPLSHAELAVANVNEIESPQHHRTRGDVYG
jgi:hypothetical protein